MDGIEFGQVEYREPESQLRPDQNRKFCVVVCGKVNPQQLPVFVDLDVMRDMEGHARTNTHVELGGVLLGGKYLDEQGQPFVMVCEALRAEHYEATRGSFKFTHETWAQITRDRDQFPSDLHLVGWYHTHPDWGVFLSGMDTFICDNFFNDDLDVDLVIDPCRGDRGWFFWDQVGKARKKQRLNGFYLFASRYRRSELLQFAQALSEENPAYFDPRYETPMGDSTMQPVVNIHDQKSPVLMIAVLGMLTIQMLVLGLIAWRMLAAPPTVMPLAEQQRSSLYREILGQMVEGTSAAGGVLARVEDLASNNLKMQTDLDGRDLLIQRLQSENQKLTTELGNQRESLSQKNNRLLDRDQEIGRLKADLKAAQELNSDITQGKPIGRWKWPWLAGCGLAGTLLGLLFGTWLGQRLRSEEDYETGHEPDRLGRERPVELRGTRQQESPLPPDLTIGHEPDDEPNP